MTEFTSLKAIALLTKLYTGYAYSLAFIFQSGIVLLLAFISSGLFIFICRHRYRKSLQSNFNITRNRLVHGYRR